MTEEYDEYDENDEYLSHYNEDDKLHQALNELKIEPFKFGAPQEVPAGSSTFDDLRKALETGSNIVVSTTYVMVTKILCYVVLLLNLSLQPKSIISNKNRKNT